MPIKRSNISWTDYSGGDANFVLGCQEVSPGCARCYAAAIAKRGGWDFHNVRIFPEKLKRLEKASLGQQFDWEVYPRRGYDARPMVFVCDMSDLFHKDVPDEFILEALADDEKTQ